MSIRSPTSWFASTETETEEEGSLASLGSPVGSPMADSPQAMISKVPPRRLSGSRLPHRILPDSLLKFAVDGLRIRGAAEPGLPLNLLEAYICEFEEGLKAMNAREVYIRDLEDQLNVVRGEVAKWKAEAGTLHAKFVSHRQASLADAASQEGSSATPEKAQQDPDAIEISTAGGVADADAASETYISESNVSTSSSALGVLGASLQERHGAVSPSVCSSGPPSRSGSSASLDLALGSSLIGALLDHSSAYKGKGGMQPVPGCWQFPGAFLIAAKSGSAIQATETMDPSSNHVGRPLQQGEVVEVAEATLGWEPDSNNFYMWRGRIQQPGTATSLGWLTLADLNGRCELVPRAQPQERPKWCIGDRVEAPWPGTGAWMPGTVTAEVAAATPIDGCRYAIRWDMLGAPQIIKAPEELRRFDFGAGSWPSWFAKLDWSGG